ncbi:MAG: hypothetical protein MR739_02180 [Spirochaetia bacterium]|nr:hypothetical protein [Spirochaetia bacterium]
MAFCFAKNARNAMHFSSRVCIANSRFSGFRYRFIPSLRFGTGFASHYNTCHFLKLKNSKLNLNSSSI